jgi:hypothetical protein
MFPVRYELDFYILFRRNSVFKGLTALACSLSLLKGKAILDIKCVSSFVQVLFELGQGLHSTSASPANSHSTDCSIFIHHPIIDAMLTAWFNNKLTKQGRVLSSGM